MSKQMSKGTQAILVGQQGFALITAIMLLFVAMILGLMVVDSADMEILLSGAQQRYEDSLNTTEGGAGSEAAAISTGNSIDWAGSSRSYAVVNPSVQNQVLSPTNSGAALFDPGSDLPATSPYTVNTSTDPALWPMENLLNSTAAANDNFDYQYRGTYLHDDSPPKGYDVTKFSGYLFEISAQRTTVVEMGGNKVGPKMSL
jgi:hypothetical protein